MRKNWEFNGYAVITGKGALVRHIEGFSMAPMLFRSKWQATKTATAVQLGSEVVKVEIKMKRRFR